MLQTCVPKYRRHFKQFNQRVPSARDIYHKFVKGLQFPEDPVYNLGGLSDSDPTPPINSFSDVQEQILYSRQVASQEHQRAEAAAAAEAAATAAAVAAAAATQVASSAVPPAATT